MTAHHLFRNRFHDIVDGERIVFAYDPLLDGKPLEPRAEATASCRF